jgi:hypothetical protein
MVRWRTYQFYSAKAIYAHILTTHNLVISIQCIFRKSRENNDACARIYKLYQKVKHSLAVPICRNDNWFLYSMWKSNFYFDEETLNDDLVEIQKHLMRKLISVMKFYGKC